MLMRKSSDFRLKISRIISHAQIILIYIHTPKLVLMSRKRRLINLSSEPIVCTNSNIISEMYHTIPHTYPKFRAILKRSLFNFR